ncbi:MAG: PDZ domain-containing protein [Acidobacteriota bacterium]
MSRVIRLLTLVIVVGCLPAPARAQAPVAYRLSYPAPEHRWMQVEVTFADVPPGTLEVRMSRTSPGRYALHEFAKNVFDVQVRDGRGRVLVPARPNLHQWNVSGHDGTVVVVYKVYGDRVDGTYLSVDSTHAHMNIPATLMWARGLEWRAARVTLERPAGRSWRVATQLYATDDPLTFTAPNLAYLMDSPTEFSDFVQRSFVVPDAGGARPTFRIALHHDGTDAEADAFARDTETIVREALAIFGEFPAFEGNAYTFLADYLPWASGDGMEHRNSTVLSSAGALRNPGQRSGLLGTVAHEFFHAWNMERLRSRALEPFDFEDADMSGELWFGEGFTSYYDDLIMQRARLVPLDATLASYAGLVNSVTLGPGRRIRTAEDMSMLAPFVDAAVSVDRTAWPNTFISYYTWGAAIGLALDLSLRDRTDGRVTLDDYMAALWRSYGRPGQQGPPGTVATPYTMADLEAKLGEVAGSAEFSRDFFARFIRGHEAADYARLFARAGFVLRARNAGRPWLGGVQLAFSGGAGARVQGLVPFDSPLYKAGVAQDDQITAIDGVALDSQAALDAVAGRHRPGDTVSIRFVRRGGEAVDARLTFDEDPRQELVPVEATGSTLTPDQKRFRDAWLNSRATP